MSIKETIDTIKSNKVAIFISAHKRWERKEKRLPKLEELFEELHDIQRVIEQYQHNPDRAIAELKALEANRIENKDY